MRGVMAPMGSFEDLPLVPSLKTQETHESNEIE